ELESQIRRAAKKVCGAQNFQRTCSVKQLMENRSCYDKAVAEAMKSISTTA
ncbi:MAG: UrcA family protein, partial [Pseudomonadales bacterium]|nr:UrcA family protein [Pseudomonadales bacterium]